MLDSTSSRRPLVIALAAALATGCLLFRDLSPIADAPPDAADGGGGDVATPRRVCEPGTRRACYDGDPTLRAIGVCAEGTQACDDAGAGFLACEGSVGPRAESCATSAIDENCDGEPSCTGALRLAVALGDGQSQRVLATATDGARVFVAGESFGKVDLGARLPATTPTSPPTTLLPQSGDRSLADGFVVALDGGGHALWASSLPDGAWTSISYAKGTLVVGGKLNASSQIADCPPLVHAGLGDAVIARLDPATGKCLAARAFGDPKVNEITAVAVDPVSGDIFAAGHVGGSLDLGDGLPVVTQGAVGRDGFVIQFDPTLRATAIDHLQGATTTVRALAVGANGTPFVGGSWTGTLSINGRTLYTTSGTNGFLAQLRDVIGVTWFTGNRLASVDAVRLDRSGRPVVAGTFTGALTMPGFALDPVTSAGSSDVFVARVLPGAHVATARFRVGGPDAETLGGLELDGFDQIVIAGTHSGKADLGGGALGGPGLYLARYDAEGAHLWSRGVPIAASADGLRGVGGVVTDALGHVWWGGWFAGPGADFEGRGATLLTAATPDTIDGFVVKSAP